MAKKKATNNQPAENVDCDDIEKLKDICACISVMVDFVSFPYVLHQRLVICDDIKKILSVSVLRKIPKEDREYLGPALIAIENFTRIRVFSRRIWQQIQATSLLKNTRILRDAWYCISMVEGLVWSPLAIENAVFLVTHSNQPLSIRRKRAIKCVRLACRNIFHVCGSPLLRVSERIHALIQVKKHGHSGAEVFNELPSRKPAKTRNDNPSQLDVKHVRNVMERMVTRNPTVESIRKAVKDAGYKMSAKKIGNAIKIIREQ